MKASAKWNVIMPFPVQYECQCHGYGEDPKAAQADGISIGNDLYLSLQSLTVYTVAGWKVLAHSDLLRDLRRSEPGVADGRQNQQQVDYLAGRQVQWWAV